MIAIFDYIVVGAGSAGSVIANRLSESGKNTVLVLEAGGSDLRFFVQMPIGYGKTYYDKNVNWKYTTEPDPGLGNKPSYWPRGKVLGGSSSINAMVYVRGHPQDYNDWARDAPGWDWNNIAPVFKTMEDWSGGADNYRGAGGPVAVHNPADDVHPLCQRYLTATSQLQIPANPDYNGQSMDGATLYQITTKDGLRASSARCYLRPALGRNNLTLKTRAHVLKVLFDGKRASGVAYRHRRRDHHVEAHKEVILCGGAINSPQLLHLSGVGSETLLSSFGIEIRQHSPQVGQNLQDHLGADMICRSTLPSLNQQLGTWQGRMEAGLQFLLFRKGPLTLSVNQAGGFVRLTPGADRPDVQLYFSPLSYTRAATGTRPLIKPDPFPGFLLGYNPCKPTSTGSVEIQSIDPLVAPKMQPNYLSTEYDRTMMLKGMRLMRRLSATPVMSKLIDDELYPGKPIQTDDDMNEFIQQNAWTVFHQCGTCRMGTNEATSVVNARLNVHGVSGLRVADASIFPTIPTGNTNAPSIMVGEKASELILQDNP